MYHQYTTENWHFQNYIHKIVINSLRGKNDQTYKFIN
jgi:hypothetical protein